MSEAKAKPFNQYVLDAYSGIRRQQEADVELFKAVFTRFDSYEGRNRDRHRVTRLTPISGQLTEDDFACTFSVANGKITVADKSFSEVEKAVHYMGDLFGAWLVKHDDAQQERASVDLGPAVRVTPKQPLYPV